MDNKRIRQNSTRISVEENRKRFLGIMWIKRIKNSPESEYKQTDSGETVIKGRCLCCHFDWRKTALYRNKIISLRKIHSLHIHSL